MSINNNFPKDVSHDRTDRSGGVHGNNNEGRSEGGRNIGVGGSTKTRSTSDSRRGSLDSSINVRAGRSDEPRKAHWKPTKIKDKIANAFQNMAAKRAHGKLEKVIAQNAEKGAQLPSLAKLRLQKFAAGMKMAFKDCGVKLTHMKHKLANQLPKVEVGFSKLEREMYVSGKFFVEGNSGPSRLMEMRNALDGLKEWSRQSSPNKDAAKLLVKQFVRELANIKAELRAEGKILKIEELDKFAKQIRSDFLSVGRNIKDAFKIFSAKMKCDRNEFRMMLKAAKSGTLDSTRSPVSSLGKTGRDLGKFSAKITAGFNHMSAVARGNMAKSKGQLEQFKSDLKNGLVKERFQKLHNVNKAKIKASNQQTKQALEKFGQQVRGLFKKVIHRGGNQPTGANEPQQPKLEPLNADNVWDQFEGQKLPEHLRARPSVSSMRSDYSDYGGSRRSSISSDSGREPQRNPSIRDDGRTRDVLRAEAGLDDYFRAVGVNDSGAPQESVRQQPKPGLEEALRGIGPNNSGSPQSQSSGNKRHSIRDDGRTRDVLQAEAGLNSYLNNVGLNNPQPNPQTTPTRRESSTSSGYQSGSGSEAAGSRRSSFRGEVNSNPVLQPDVDGDDEVFLPQSPVPTGGVNPFTGGGSNATNPFLNEGQRNTNPFLNEGQRNTNPFLNEGQRNTNPFLNEGQRNTNPFLNEGQRNTNPFLNEGQRNTNPFLNEGQRNTNPFIDDDTISIAGSDQYIDDDYQVDDTGRTYMLALQALQRYVDNAMANGVQQDAINRVLGVAVDESMAVDLPPPPPAITRRNSLPAGSTQDSVGIARRGSLPAGVGGTTGRTTTPPAAPAANNQANPAGGIGLARRNSLPAGDRQTGGTNRRNSLP